MAFSGFTVADTKMYVLEDIVESTIVIGQVIGAGGRVVVIGAAVVVVLTMPVVVPGCSEDGARLVLDSVPVTGAVVLPSIGVSVVVIGIGVVVDGATVVASTKQAMTDSCTIYTGICGLTGLSNVIVTYTAVMKGVNVILNSS
jgi:hypothetical protein